jgi:undecaprenyl-diphosphatase
MAFVVILVCYSRVYLGVHYPLDVLMGMFSGAVYGLTVVRIKNSLFKLKKS